MNCTEGLNNHLSKTNEDKKFYFVPFKRKKNTLKRGSEKIMTLGWLKKRGWAAEESGTPGELDIVTENRLYQLGKLFSSRTATLEYIMRREELFPLV